MKPFLLLILLILPVFAHSQDKKIEKEEGINRNQMPGETQNYLEENLPEDINKLRHYYETDGKKKVTRQNSNMQATGLVLSSVNLVNWKTLRCF